EIQLATQTPTTHNKQSTPSCVPPPTSVVTSMPLGSAMSTKPHNTSGATVVQTTTGEQRDRLLALAGCHSCTIHGTRQPVGDPDTVQPRPIDINNPESYHGTDQSRIRPPMG